MSSPRYKFRRFLKRHHALFPFVGALIVFVTFIVKEELWERWRSTAAEIDRAQEMYASRVQTEDLKKRIEGVNVALKRIHEAVNHHSTPPLAYYFEYGKRGLSEIQASLADMDSLLTRVKTAKKEEEELHGFEEELPKAKLEVENLDDVIRFESPSKPVGGNPWIYASKKPKQPKDPIDEFLDETEGDNTISDRVTEFRVSVREFGRDVDDLNARVLAVADQLKQTNETKSRYASFITLILFVLGWGVGLLGKLSGDTGMAEE